MAFVNSHVLRWKNFYFLYLILLLPIYTEHRNNSRKLCLTPAELLLLADWMHSSYCNDTGVLLKRLGLMKHIPSEMLNLLYHVHLYTTAMFFQMSLLANRTIEKMKFSRIPFLVVGTISICFCWPNWYFFPFHGTHEIVFSRLFNHWFFCYFKIMWVVDQDTQNKLCQFEFWFTRKYKQFLF